MNGRYALLHEVPGQARELLRLTGPDAARFAQGTFSADLTGIGAEAAVAATLLTIKGKIVSELVMTGDRDGSLLAFVPRDTADEVQGLLDKHIIMDDVEVARVPNVCSALVWGTDSQPEGADVQVRSTRHPAPGWLLWGAEEQVRSALGACTPASAVDFDLHRVETGTPGWRHELEPGRFPPEVGFVYAVSYDKGCYLGQEPLARIHARGQVNWVMARVSAARVPGDDVTLSHPDRAEAGRWTTAVASDGEAKGLAIVRREFAKEGAVLQLADGAAVTVRSGPLGDDPGVRGKA